MPFTRPYSASSGTQDGRCLYCHPLVDTPEQLICLGVPWVAGPAACHLPSAPAMLSWAHTTFPAILPRRFSLRPQDGEACAPWTHCAGVPMVRLSVPHCPLPTAVVIANRHGLSGHLSSADSAPQRHGCELTQGAQPQGKACAMSPLGTQQLLPAGLGGGWCPGYLNGEKTLPSPCDCS